MKSQRVFTLVVIALLPGLVLAQNDTGSPDTTNIFGVVEAFWLPDAACELGVGWERIIFDWAQHQPTGPDDWNTLNVDERWLRAAQDCDREVVALLKTTPDWATDGTPGIGVPTGLDLPLDHPENYWARFVRRAAAHYAPFGVRHFIIWNEPDIEPGVYGYEFEGELDDYAEMLRVAYQAARAGNPDAVIHLAGTTYWHDLNHERRPYLDRLLEQLAASPTAAENNHYFDAVTLHIYFRSESVMEVVGAVQAILDQHGLGDKRIWIVETNASPNRDPLWPVVRPAWQTNLEQQAAYLVQAAALALVMDVERISVYKLYDWNLPPGAESFGLIRVDETRRPAFESWQLVIDQFNNVEAARLARTGRVNVVQLERADGQTVLAAWARTPAFAQVQVSATSETAHLLDQYGNMVMLRPFAGRYTLDLPGATCNRLDGCAVGGPVALLVQPRAAVDIHELTAAGMVTLTFE